MVFPRLVRVKDPLPDALSERSDDELMALARGGLRSAFAILVERHAERVVRLCARFVSDTQLGRELAQDTWVLVWQARDKYRAEGGFVPWLITVARNHCRNELRRRRNAERRDELSAPDGPSSPGQLDSLLVEERRQRVRRALETLSPALREALLLRYAEGLRYDEITQVVGAGESTLRSRVHHGLKALKQKLEEEP
jgi:RNA polymerase sigma-70 factor, ECF subfamily